MYRAGVIGCGRIGCGFLKDPLRGTTSTHAGSYMFVDSVELAALCDIREGLAQQYGKRLGVHYIYTGWPEMLAQGNLEIVSVCTPVDTHKMIVCNAARSPGVKAIYCEKPMASSSSAAERMIQVCEANGVLLIINHQRRFSPLHQEIAALIWEGELGRIQQATCYYGGGIYESGSHLFDLLRFYLGEVVGAGGHFSPSSSHRPGDPNIDGWLQFVDRSRGYIIPVVIQACDSAFYNIFEINILGTRGRLRVFDSGRSAEISRVGPSPTFSGLQEMQGPKPLLLSIPHGAPSRWIPRGIEHLLDCLETGTQPISSGRDGLVALKIIEALESGARGE